MCTIGDRIRELRLAKKVTQKEVADAIGVSSVSVQRFEYGSVRPSLDTLTSLANYFDVPVDYLLGNGIYGQLQSVPNLKEELATRIEEQLGADLFQSLLGGPLSAADDVTLGKIADLLVEEIQICEDGGIVIRFKR